jgi:peptidoglycan biosynthesis protein MviN/MurJ (putative lipid II flippase)
VVNLILSVVLIQSFGLTGVAWGTLIPIAAASFFVLYPAACRRVGLPLSRAIVHSVVPAVWPALIVAGLLAFTRHISSGTLLAVALQAVLGGVVYLALFFTVAIGKRDRAEYVSKVTQVTRRRRLQPAGSL